MGWKLTRSIYAYCDQCKQFKNGSFWRYFVSETQSRHCVCEECGEALLEGEPE